MTAAIRIVSDDTTIRLFRGDEPLLGYNLPRAGSPPAWRTNFIHPFVSRGSASITEDEPADHPHHRGIFWAWRRIIVGDKSVDSWAGKDFAFATVERFADVSQRTAEITADIDWLVHGLRVVAERTLINLRDDDGKRHVDITIALRALVPNVAIAGTDDAKAYGGPTIRFAHAGLIEAESEGRRLDPVLGAIETGATVDFTWRERPQDFPRRVSASCLVDGKPWTSWILRREPGMQNAAFPGQTPRPLSTEKDLVIGLSLRIKE